MERVQKTHDYLATLVLFARESDVGGLLSRARMLGRAEKLVEDRRFEDAYALTRQLSGQNDGLGEQGRLLQIRILDALANDRAKQERYTDCLYYLAEWSQLAPDDLYPLLRRAEILQFAMGQPEQAIAELFQLVKRAPRCVEAWVQLAYTALSNVKPDTRQGRSELGKRSSGVPYRLTDGVRFTIRAWRALRSPQWAYEPYREVVVLVADLLYEVTARALLLCGFHDEAMRVLSGARETIPDVILFQRSGALMRSATPLKVALAGQCHPLIQSVDHDLATRLIAAATLCDNAADLIAAGNYENALHTLRQSETSTKSLLRKRFRQLEVEALSSLAEKYRVSGDLSAELHYLEQWLRVEPSNPFARFRYGEILSQRGEFGTARVVVQQLLRRYPACVDAWVELASIDMRCRHRTSALRHLLKAWNSLQSAQWAYYPSESVLRVGLEALFCRTALALCWFRKYEDALDVLKHASRQLGTSEQIQRLLKQVEQKLM